MARFCTKCGSPMGEGMQFCTNCGTQVPAAVAQAPVAPTPTSPVAAAPARVAPAGVAVSKKASPLVKIVLIVVGIFAIVTVAGIGSCLYIGYRVKKRAEQIVQMDKSGGSITINTPQGALKLGQQSGSASEPIGGVPPYPGSAPVDQGGEISLGGMGSIGGREFVTDDPVEKVVDFYKVKFGSNLSVVENQGHYRLALTRTVGEASDVTTIDVSKDEESGKTKIFIAHMGK